MSGWNGAVIVEQTRDREGSGGAWQASKVGFIAGRGAGREQADGYKAARNSQRFEARGTKCARRGEWI